MALPSRVLLHAILGQCSRRSRAPHAHLVQQEAIVALEEPKRQSPVQQVLTAQRAPHARYCVQLVHSERQVEVRRSKAVLLVAQASTANFQEAAQLLGLASQAFFVVLGQPLRLLGPWFGVPKFQPPLIL